MKLEEVVFQTPCTVPWSSMKGDDRVRFCDQCRKNVTNLADMPRAEAEAFLDRTRGSACIQLWKRPDGTIVTSDCGQPPPPQPTMTGGMPLS
jgi:hypothetical protein